MLCNACLNWPAPLYLPEGPCLLCAQPGQCLCMPEQIWVKPADACNCFLCSTNQDPIFSQYKLPDGNEPGEMNTLP